MARRRIIAVSAVTALVIGGGGVAYSLDDYRVREGPFARSAPCAAMVPRLPEDLLGRARDSVGGAGVVGWGDGSVVLRCGVQPLAPTTDTCVNVNGFDWVLNDEEAERKGVWVFTTYGRVPAVEVSFKGSQLAGDVLVKINDSVREIPPTSRCLSLEDTP
ncbi:DUF3515 family protein [Streptomyces sp. NPDC048606]|uniref:DUF3515 family protein n=1 Tax=Streptomyces sp. NPDC048606 TaxID=3154726 RepID=UPI00343F8FC0